MNPSPYEIWLGAYNHRRTEELKKINQERLHKEAVARRKKRKRGGKK